MQEPTSDAPSQADLIVSLAFPQNEDTVPLTLECGNRLSVSSDISCKLLFPEGSIAGGRRRSYAPGMTVPEAAVHKDDPATGSVGNVRRTRKVAVSHPVAMTECRQLSSNSEFWRRVLLPDAGHSSGCSCVQLETRLATTSHGVDAHSCPVAVDSSRLMKNEGELIARPGTSRTPDAVGRSPVEPIKAMRRGSAACSDGIGDHRRVLVGASQVTCRARQRLFWRRRPVARSALSRPSSAAE